MERQEQAIRHETQTQVPTDLRYIRPYEIISADDVKTVGGKNANLGEMITELKGRGVNVPSGFCTTSEAYRHFMRHNDLMDKVKQKLEGVTLEDKSQLQEVGKWVREAMTKASLPSDLEQHIRQGYSAMEKQYSTRDVSVAVRSSATAEDLPEASFAGQQDTFLNIRGIDEVLEACKRCFASLFNDRAISYRLDNGFAHEDVALSVGIELMVQSEVSGVMFTLDTESGFRDVVLINASWGLGENVVQGIVDPDDIFIHKPTLKHGYRPVLRKRLGSKHKTMVFRKEATIERKVSGMSATENVDTPPEKRAKYCITEDDALELARQALIIEEHYSSKRGKSQPQDIEWAKSKDGSIWIVQTRPETVQSTKAPSLETYSIKEESVRDRKVLISGKSIGSKIASGKARTFDNVEQMESLKDGEIIVTESTDPDMEPMMARAAAIITERGGRTSHAAIVSREIGIPAIVGCGDARQKIHDGQMVTVDCHEGEVGKVWDGEIEFEVRSTDVGDVSMPEQFDLMMIAGNPEEVLQLARLPHKGCGLARLEFIIANTVQVHPMALIHPEHVEDEETQKKIQALLSAEGDRYQKNRPQYFVDKLAQEAGTIAAAFYPWPVIIRLSDFKTNEYASLLGGKAFEPHEHNPMLGFRGASRYHHPLYREAFALECAAMKKIRAEMGLKNVKLMIPFCRTVDEGKNVLETMAQNGLKRGEDGLEVYMMTELPSNVVLIDEFCQIFDGFSIGR